MRFALDANIVIALMAGNERVTARIEQEDVDDVIVPSVVLHELLYGAYGSQRIDENVARLGKLRFEIVQFDDSDARAAGELRAKLKRQGTPIGPYDVLIAGQALARNLTVVTANTREFERVTGLKVENWLA